MLLDNKNLIKTCRQVLTTNASDGYTVPSRDLYPHQWLWDSCFTAIGLRHIDTKRAKQELVSLKRGAWSNGMLPNIIFRDKFLNYDHSLWQSKLSPEAPLSFNTTGITQPPMLAEAVLKVGQKLEKPERKEWFKIMYDCILNYHLWLYNERNPDQDGLIIQIHPYESGLDNSPPWMYLLGRLNFPWWVRATNAHGAQVALNHFRRDTAHIPASERIGLKAALECFYIIRRLSNNQYKFKYHKKYNLPVMQDLAFNCILIRANECLKEIADELGETLPDGLLSSISSTEKSLEKLWDPKTNEYYSRNFRTKKLIRKSSIATFLPLYARCIPKDRAELLAAKLNDSNSFMPAYPVPSVPINSKKFSPDRYWQGPTWINTNWMIVQGLKSYGYKGLAQAISDSSLKLVDSGGAFEYYSPIDGSPKGAKDFSWTAALAIDLASE